MDTKDRATTAQELASKYAELAEFESLASLKRFAEIADKLDEAKALVKEGKALKKEIKPVIKQMKALRKEISKLTKQLTAPRNPRKAKDAGIPATPESQVSEQDKRIAFMQASGGVEPTAEDLASIEPQPTDSPQKAPAEPSEPTTEPKKGKKGKKGSKKSKGDTDAGKGTTSESKTPTLAEIKRKALEEIPCQLCGGILGKTCTCPKG